jgi:hypothetical protein
LRAEADAFGGRSPVVTELREPADAHAYQEDKQGAFQYLHAGGTAEFEIILFQGDIRGNAHDEHEEREYEVGGGKPVPFRMAQGGIDAAPRAGIVHHDHPCDGDTAQDIEGENAFVCFYRSIHDLCALSWLSGLSVAGRVHSSTR